MRILLSACLFLANASMAQSQPPSFSKKINDTPDFLQTDKSAGFTKGGTRYCGPVAASNSLLWLAKNGYPKLKPPAKTEKESQISLIRKLASANLMDTEDEAKNGTSVGRFLVGLDGYIKQNGYACERLEMQGISPTLSKDWEHARKAQEPNPDWVKEAISHPKGVAWLHVGWYTHDPAKNEYSRSDGHFVTLVGYRGDTFIVHNPAPWAGTNVTHDELKSQKLTAGSLISNGKARSADGFYRLTGESLRTKAPVCILENAIVLIAQ